MMEGGNDNLFSRAVEALERFATSNEKIVELATAERVAVEAHHPGPPFCPNCGVFNPEIQSEGGGGLMGDFVLAGMCRNCNKMIYAIPEGWQIFTTAQEARDALGGGNGTT